jgi:hypothetical protein
MSPDVLYLIATYGVVPVWLLLVIAPHARLTMAIVHSAAMPLLLALAYGVLLFTDRAGDARSHMFTLDGVMAIFDRPQVVVAAWIHYLVFDLFVGAWEVRDAKRRGIEHVLVIPCLLLTFVFGPLGLATYLLLRFAKRKVFTLVE